MRHAVNCAILSVVVICGLGSFIEPARASAPDQKGHAAFAAPRLWEYTAPLIAPEKRDLNPSRAQKDPTVVFYGGKWHVFMTIDPGNLRRLFQGMWDKDKSGTSCGQFQWRLGILTPVAAAAVPH